MKVSFSARQPPSAKCQTGHPGAVWTGTPQRASMALVPHSHVVASPFIYLLFKIFWPYIVWSAPGYISLHKDHRHLQRERHGPAGFGEGWRCGIPRPTVSPNSSTAVGPTDQRTAGTDRPCTDLQAPGHPSRQSKESQVPDTLGLYRQLVDQALQAVDFQQQRLDKVKLLFEQRAATAAEVNAVTAQFDAAQHNLTQARLDLATAESSLRPTPPPASQQEKSQKTLKFQEELKQTLRQLEADREACTPRAPQAGIVLEIAATKGKIINAGEYLALIGRPEYPQVIAYIRPESASAVSVGRKATVTLPGGPSLLAKSTSPQPRRGACRPISVRSLARGCDGDRDPRHYRSVSRPPGHRKPARGCAPSPVLVEKKDYKL